MLDHRNGINCPSITAKSHLSIFKTQLKTYLFRLAYPQMYSSQRSICLILFTLHLFNNNNNIQHLYSAL